MEDNACFCLKTTETALAFASLRDETKLSVCALLSVPTGPYTAPVPVQPHKAPAVMCHAEPRADWSDGLPEIAAGQCVHCPHTQHQRLG